MQAREGRPAVGRRVGPNEPLMVNVLERLMVAIMMMAPCNT